MCFETVGCLLGKVYAGILDTRTASLLDPFYALALYGSNTRTAWPTSQEVLPVTSRKVSNHKDIDLLKCHDQTNPQTKTKPAESRSFQKSSF